MHTLKLVLIIIVSLTTPDLALAKAKCKSLLKKLHNVQAIQRQGYSLREGKSLAKKEAKARNEWWQCERGINNKVKAKKNKTAKSVKKTRVKKSDSKSLGILENTASASFSSQSSVGVKSKYTGEQLKRWLAFYQPLMKCQRPKSTQVFAYCVEYKRQQQQMFEMQDELN